MGWGDGVVGGEGGWGNSELVCVFRQRCHLRLSQYVLSMVSMKAEAIEDNRMIIMDP